MSIARFHQKTGSLIYALPFSAKNEKGMIPVSAILVILYFCEKTFPLIIFWKPCTNVTYSYHITNINIIIIINYNTSIDNNNTY